MPVAEHVRTHTKLDADESAAFLAGKLRKRQRFFFVRYGDGALECIYGKGRGQTCDGERYTLELAYELHHLWKRLVREPEVYVGDWLSASFGHDRTNEYAAEYARLIGDATPNWLHFECLLLMRRSQALLDFYKAVKSDPRRKLYFGPAAHGPAARMLGCSMHVITPMEHLFKHVDILTDRLAAYDFDVLLYGAGMAGNIPVSRMWDRFPERTYINLGSAMDPIWRGRTRRDQLSADQAREFLNELL